MNINFNNAVDSVVVQATGPDSLGGGNAADGGTGPGHTDRGPACRSQPWAASPAVRP